jgi:FKBP-type peptidyl-prolyl cis-trans isomerase FkpA
VTRAAVITIITLLAVALPGCADARPEIDGAEVARSYAPSLDVNLAAMDRHESGLYTRDLVVGEGEPAEAGDLIVVHYTGWLPDGTQFGSSRDGEPMAIVIGAGRLIRGWDEGIPGMRPGGRRQLVIPPDLAYGAEGRAGVIPPSATLVFDVELLEARPVGAGGM